MQVDIREIQLFRLFLVILVLHCARHKFRSAHSEKCSASPAELGIEPVERLQFAQKTSIISAFSWATKGD
jgi:hypothetical protein